MTRRAFPTQAEIGRAIRAAKKEGAPRVVVGSIIIDLDGKDEPSSPQSTGDKHQPKREIVL